MKLVLAETRHPHVLEVSVRSSLSMSLRLQPLRSSLSYEEQLLTVSLPYRNTGEITG